MERIQVPFVVRQLDIVDNRMHLVAYIELLAMVRLVKNNTAVVAAPYTSKGQI